MQQFSISTSNQYYTKTYCVNALDRSKAIVMALNHANNIQTIPEELSLIESLFNLRVVPQQENIYKIKSCVFIKETLKMSGIFLKTFKRNRNAISIDLQ